MYSRDLSVSYGCYNVDKFGWYNVQISFLFLYLHFLPYTLLTRQSYRTTIDVIFDSLSYHNESIVEYVLNRQVRSFGPLIYDTLIRILTLSYVRCL